MDARFEKCLAILEESHLRLSRALPAPKKVWAGRAYTYRFEERSLEQALVQKLARLVTGLRAAQLLVQNGFLQEQVVLHRSLQEIEEDIFFLSFGRISGRIGKLHEQYLEAFYQEPGGSPFSIPQTQSNKPLQRPKIRDWIAGVEVPDVDVSESSKASRAIYSLGSGYVHAASAQVMELYAGPPEGWQLNGMGGGQLREDHLADAWNYFYRGVLSFGFAARAIGDDELAMSLQSFAQELGRASGKDYFADL